MSILENIGAKTTALYSEFQSAWVCDKKGRKTAFGLGLVLGAPMNLAVLATADGTDIKGFGADITEIITEVYNAAFGVITVLAAVLLIIAFAVRMTQNQQKAAQATSWIVRIIVCYIGINCIGLLFNVIENTTGKHRSTLGTGAAAPIVSGTTEPTTPTTGG